MSRSPARSRIANQTRPARRGTRAPSGGSRADQLGLGLAPRFGWGGARKGAGRKRGKRASHASRPALARGRPVHATLRVRGDLPSLRCKALLTVLEDALHGVLGREGFRVIHYSVQSNHAHLIIEATSGGALGRGMQALSIRMAKGVNRALGRRGPVLSDRYHARALRTPREVRNALCYVLQNHRRHVAAGAARAGAIVDPTWIDPCSSGFTFDGWRHGAPAPHRSGAPPPVSAPRFWLVTVGWRRHGLLAIDEVPAAAWA
jgi:REP-associated tyrosine transposase